jgi:hypothetical protein
MRYALICFEPREKIEWADGEWLSMDRTHYNQWEEDKNMNALFQAKELFDDYKNNNIKYVKYKTDQSNKVQEYILMKVWHILNGSGVFLDFKVYKKGMGCLVVIRLQDI